MNERIFKNINKTVTVKLSLASRYLAHANLGTIHETQLALALS